MTKDAYFSLLTRTKQLLLVTFCDTLAGIEVSFWADGTGRTNGWTDGRGSRNSYLDEIIFQFKACSKEQDILNFSFDLFEKYE